MMKGLVLKTEERNPCYCSSSEEKAGESSHSAFQTASLVD